MQGKIRTKSQNSGLEALLSAVRQCRICRDAPAAKPLPHEPRPVLQVSREAKLLIAGQAPGTRVHASGRPFTDPSGDRLRAWLGIASEIFYDERKIAIVPMGLCFPGLSEKGADLPPRRECAPAWRSRIMAELPAIELIVAVGHYAQAWHMPENVKPTLTETVRAWKNGLKLSPPVIPLPHPSWRNSGWLKENPWFERDVLPELRSRVSVLL
jgi:uracil-DNA glycosylase